MKSLLCVFTAIAILACSSESSSTTATTCADVDVAGTCASNCSQTHACDPSIDVASCESKCQSGLAAQWERLRCDFRIGYADCFSALECSSKLSNGGNSCMAQGIAGLVPSPQGQSFCTAISTAAESCNAIVSRDNCLDLTKTFSDLALTKAEACTRKSCTDGPPCISEALPGYSF